MRSSIMSMDTILRDELGVTQVKSIGHATGCISDGQSFETEDGRIFVKLNKKPEAQRMFDGEFASLEAIMKTETVRVPKPWKVIPSPDGCGSLFVMEHLDIKGLKNHSAKLGKQLADMHLYNKRRMYNAEKNSSRVGGSKGGGSDDVQYVSQFGFHVPTCCGYLPQDNSWSDKWVEFYAQRKLKQQLDWIERDYNDRQVRELWPQLLRILPKLFKDLEVYPSLLHGDLWGGNTAETDSDAVIFDPASFYGHSEFDLGIAGMFGGFDQAFYSAYHGQIPKENGFDSRHQLYKLFHYLNHWNHFGSGYKGSSLSIMQQLAHEYS